MYFSLLNERVSPALKYVRLECKDSVPFCCWKRTADGLLGLLLDTPSTKWEISKKNVEVVFNPPERIFNRTSEHPHTAVMACPTPFQHTKLGPDYNELSGSGGGGPSRTSALGYRMYCWLKTEGSGVYPPQMCVHTHTHNSISP